MSSATYQNILREVEQLTNEERRHLADELASKSVETSLDLSTILLNLPAFDLEAIDAMERAIEEDCEGIDPNAWQ